MEKRLWCPGVLKAHASQGYWLNDLSLWGPYAVSSIVKKELIKVKDTWMHKTCTGLCKGCLVQSLPYHTPPALIIYKYIYIYIYMYVISYCVVSYHISYYYIILYYTSTKWYLIHMICTYIYIVIHIYIYIYTCIWPII